MAENVEIVRVQSARGQYRITIPKTIVEKLNLKKGTPLFVTVEGSNIILSEVKKSGSHGNPKRHRTRTR